MNEDILKIVIASIVAPAVLLILQQLYQRRKNKADYGDDLLDIVNKSAASLKQAREDLVALETELRNNEIEHKQELDDYQKQWDERQERLKLRIKELEKFIVKYDISFTLTTHPTVQVTDLKVIGKEDTLTSQKMKAITANDIKKK